MTEDLKTLLHALSLEKADEGYYVGHYIPAIPNHVFGGQVVAQAMSAAIQEVEDDKTIHSLHSYFLEPGKTDVPFHYHVEKIRDGRSFSTRHVKAMQQDRTIYSVTMSFQRIEDGVAFQTDMPSVEPPENFINEADRWNSHPFIQQSPERQIKFQPLEVRHTGPIDWFSPTPSSPETGIWIKTKDRINDDGHIHKILLGYFSDTFLYGASLRPHGLTFNSPKVQGTSLDHAVWIHDDFRADEWLFYQHSGIWTGRARGLNFGKFYTQDGRHVASSSQEGLVRLKQA